MAIRKIVLRNFQCHRRLVIRPCRGVTTIIGRSDVGKSAVVRALRWLMFNRPSGTAFVRRGATKTAVSVLIGKHSIVRRRGKRNVYSIDGRNLVAFGARVPKDITHVHRCSDLNFQMQHDAPFWFADSGGDVSKKLNAIVSLSDIDCVVGFLRTAEREASAEIRLVEKRIAAAAGTRASLRTYRRARVAWRRVLGASGRLERLREKHTKLATILAESADIQQQRIAGQRAALAIRPLLACADALQLQSSRANVLRDLMTEIDRLETLSTSDIRSCVEIATSLEEGVVRRESLNGLVAKAEATQGEVDAAIVKCEEIQNQLRKAIGEICPVCRRPMSDLEM